MRQTLASRRVREGRGNGSGDDRGGVSGDCWRCGRGAGRSAVGGVSALVRRPFHRDHAAGDAAVVLPSGEAELAALEQSPADERRAVALAEVLVARADADGGFRQALQGWWEQASQLHVGGGNVANTISGGSFHGPVLQGRDFTGLTFGSPAAPPPDRPAQDLDAGMTGEQPAGTDNTISGGNFPGPVLQGRDHQRELPSHARHR